DVDVPDNVIVLTYVTVAKTIGGRRFDHPVHLAVHVPEEGRAFARAASVKTRGNRAPGLHPKLARYRPSREDVQKLIDAGVDPEFPPHIDDLQDAIDAAVALLFHHGNLINLNTDNGGAIPAIIVDECITPAVMTTEELPI